MGSHDQKSTHSTPRSDHQEQAFTCTSTSKIAMVDGSAVERAPFKSNPRVPRNPSPRSNPTPFAERIFTGLATSRLLASALSRRPFPSLLRTPRRRGGKKRKVTKRNAGDVCRNRLFAWERQLLSVRFVSCDFCKRVCLPPERETRTKKLGTHVNMGSQGQGGWVCEWVSNERQARCTMYCTWPFPVFLVFRLCMSFGR